MTKQDLLNMVQAMPDDAPFDKIVAQLRKARVVAEIEAGLEEVSRGDVVSHEEMRRRAKEWKQNR